MMRRVGRSVREPSHWRILPLVTAALVLAAAPVGAQEGPTYGARPVPRAEGESAGGFALNVDPGSSATAAVEVFNFTNDPASFDLYSADVVITADGSRTPAARDAERVGPATWIDVDRATVTVAAQDSEIVSFVVEVPSGTASGAHTAALVVEPRSTDTTGTIVNRTRIGLWVEVAVGADAAPAPSPGASSELPWPALLAIATILVGTVLGFIGRERLGWRIGGRDRARRAEHRGALH